MKDQMLIDKYNELGKAHIETVNRLLEKDELIQKRDELINDAVAIISFLNPFKAGKSAQWIEKAKKMVGEK